MINTTYYYFSTHTINQSIYGRLESNHQYSLLPSDIQEVVDNFVDAYPKGKSSISPLDYCSKFIRDHEEELYDMISENGVQQSKYFLSQYLGYVNQWGASTQSFGKNSEKRAEWISENELIEEMTSESGTIKKLLDSAHGDLSSVKPFLPAIMISLDTNTRNKGLMEFKHTGRFCFDFDAFKDSEEALNWMKIIWKGLPGLKPYMAFLSPRGKGFKVFYRVDTSDSSFQSDYISEDREVIMKHHKVWYEGARTKLLKIHPKLEDNFDESTNDPQRLTYLPYISSDITGAFQYDKSRISDYSEITNTQRQAERKLLDKKLSKHSTEISKIMSDQGIKTKEDAYHLLLKSKKDDFDLELETDKFLGVVEFLEDLSNSDTRVSNWVYEKFNDYHTLHKMSWVLFGVFGDIAIDALKRLIPVGSNKLDESHNDYRWAVRSKDDYEEEQLISLTPGAFYALVGELGEVKDFLASNYRINSIDITDFKLLNGYYDTYEKNRDLEEESNSKADLSEFLDNVTNYIDKKKVRLPLIEELDSLTAEVKLGPSEYLDKDTMTHIYQTKYSNKKVFCLRSQCGTGKNTLAGNPDYKLKGRVILAEPFRSISDQAASEAHSKGNRKNQLFVNSGVEETILSFKESDTDTININYETSLRGVTLPSDPELVAHLTYNQILNISFDDLETIDYIFVDEAHTLSDGLSYRSDVISGLIHHLVEFVAKRRSAKTKIIFMSGTPNVETHVIPELMDNYNVKGLFQRVIIDKTYKTRPIIHLTHLDTSEADERQNQVIDQIKTYLKKGLKVCHIFNNKARMDSYIREVQNKLSNSIRIGVFYSGSTGECTKNILAGKFGDYDLVLATTYFINGINIEKDGLTLDEIKEGKASPQKYGMVIDLGQSHTRVNAMDAIQSINRFRNRKCHSTIFLPKIFKPDLNNPSNKFNFNNAAKVLLGINRYNHHLLSSESGLDAFEEDEDDEIQEKLHLIDEMRKNPLYVSTDDITRATKEEENRMEVINLISKKARLYEDWFCSLDGYHYLAKDAGFNSIIKHRSKKHDLNKFDHDQVELENKVIRNFFSNDIALQYLEAQVDPEKRIILKSSGVITDPNSADVGKFGVVKLLNEKYVVEGDFHESHERLLNTLIRVHLNLSYWYGLDLSSDLVKVMMTPEVNLLPIKTKHLGTGLLEYQKGCKAGSPSKYLTAYSYLLGVKIISEVSSNSNIEFNQTDMASNFLIHTEGDADSLKQIWAESQYDNTIYKIDESDSSEKDSIKKYYSNKGAMVDYDLLILMESLKKLGYYKKPRKSRTDSSKTSSPEKLFLSRVLRSDKLSSKRSGNLDTSDWAAPETYNLADLKLYIKTREGKLLKYFKKVDGELKLIDPIYSKNLNLPTKSSDYNEHKLLFKIELLRKVTKKVDMLTLLNSLESKILNKSRLYYNCFKYAEYKLYKECTVHGRMPSMDKLFFVEEEFSLDSILGKSEEEIIIDKDDIFELVREEFESRSLRAENYLVWVAYDKVKMGTTPIIAGTKKKSFCESICAYAYSTTPFILASGLPVKKWNVGIYNPSSFLRHFLGSSAEERKILNYDIQGVVYTKTEVTKYLKK